MAEEIFCERIKSMCVASKKDVKKADRGSMNARNQAMQRPLPKFMIDRKRVLNFCKREIKKSESLTKTVEKESDHLINDWEDGRLQAFEEVIDFLKGLKRK